MKKEIADMWISALKSGEYKQGKYKLRKGNAFCCLGVLCDLAIKNNVDIKISKSVVGYSYDDSKVKLPLKVRDWAGMLTQTGNFSSHGIAISLMRLNDNGTPFKNIAEIIETAYEEL